MDEPREIDIDMFGCPQQLLESVEDLQYKVEELQSFCDDCEKQNQQLQQRLIDKEKEYSKSVRLLNEELASLRHTKVRIARENIMKECPITPRWFNALTKSIEQEKIITDLTTKVDELNLEIMEKNKTVSALEHQLKDAEATIVVLSSDRNRMAVEVDELALRLEEIEYGRNFHKVESAKCRTDTASFNSYEDEAMSYSDKHSGIYSRTSYPSEEEAEGFLPLKRAANFSNINALDESADFKLEQQGVSREDIVVPDAPETSSTIFVGAERNDEVVKKSDPLPTCKTNDCSGMTLEKNDIRKFTSEKSETNNNFSVRHKDTSWEKFDRSDSSAKVSSLAKNETGNLSPILLDSNSESDIFEKTNECSPFAQLVESTPMSKSDAIDEEAKSRPTAGVSDDDPWVSPADSPIMETKNKTYSRNLFWEKNMDCTIYPFYIPDSNDEDDGVENDLEDKIALNVELPTKNLSDFNEAFTDEADVTSPTSLPSDFSFDDKMASFNKEILKPSNIVVKKASKENLWDFEPDSIVDVSTGQTIYESMKKDEDSQLSETESCVDGEEHRPEENDDDLSCLKKYLPKEDHVRSMSDLSSEMSEEKAKSLAKAADKRSDKLMNNHHQEIEYARKGSKKEREALKAYMQWKIHGKQGVPPANFKISLC